MNKPKKLVTFNFCSIEYASKLQKRNITTIYRKIANEKLPLVTKKVFVRDDENENLFHETDVEIELVDMRKTGA